VSRFLRAVLWDSTSTPNNDYDDGDSSYSEHHAEAANNITIVSDDTTTNTTATSTYSTNSTATATTNSTTRNGATIHNRISSVDIPIGEELLDKLASIFSIAQVR